MGILALLFIVIPALEIWLLLRVGSLIGALPTFGIIVLTGILGAALAKRQGMAVLRRVQEELAAGRLPANEMVDGILVLVAGVLLVTPGLVTDAAGFLLLVPPARAGVRHLLRKWFERGMQQGTIHVVGGNHEPPHSGGPRDIIDVTYRDAREDHPSDPGRGPI